MGKALSRPCHNTGSKSSAKFNPSFTNEPRYQPEEYRVKIPLHIAKEDIKHNFPNIKIAQIRYFSEGLDSIVFLINKELVFRFAKNRKANASIQKEIRVLPEIQKQFTFSIPVFLYTGKQRNDLCVVGYKKIEGSYLGKTDVLNPKRTSNQKIIQQLASFFQQIHAIDTTVAKQWSLREQNFHSLYTNELEDARDHIYALTETIYSNDAQRIKTYIEHLFARYLNTKDNFNYTPSVLHGDLGEQHIIFDEKSESIVGIIDWGETRIGDPAYDLFRPYSHYGNTCIENILKYYSHPSPKELYKKLDFFFRAQMIHRTVRSIMVDDKQKAKWHFERLRKHALGIGYWYHEL
jgi:aminoglycoside 2''-phosphotransferase